MRAPVSSESDAFRSVFAVAAVIAVCLVVGYALGLLPAVAVASLSVLVLLVWMLLPSDSRLRRAEVSARRAGRAPRTLLIAGEAPTEEQFRRQILGRLAPQVTLEIHAPVLQSKTHFVTTDIDQETQQARRRLIQTLRAARSAGVAASGEVGDPIDPLAGVEDELRRFAVDEVIVATHPRDTANWVESELLERLRGELDKPVIEVLVDSKQVT